jgi:hypothetical protein
MKYRCYHIALRVNHFYTNRDRCEALTNIYRLGPVLVVTGRIHDSGQNVLHHTFQIAGSRSPGYFPVFFLIAFLEEDFIRIEYNKYTVN